MKNTSTALKLILNTVKEVAEKEKHVTRNKESLALAKNSMKALLKTVRQDGKNFKEIQVSSTLLFLNLANALFPELKENEEDLKESLEIGVFGNDFEQSILNAINVLKNTLKLKKYDHEETAVLIEENFGLIDEFVEKNVDLLDNENYNSGDVSMDQVLVETMGFAFEIMIYSHYESLVDDQNLDDEDRAISTILEIEKTLALLAPLTMLSHEEIQQEWAYYEDVKSNKNRLLSRVATTKAYELSCLI